MIELFDYQQPHAERLLHSLHVHGVAKDGSDCGTGKTPVAAWVANEYITSHTVIVCPKILIPAWTQWMECSGVPNFTAVNYEKLRTGNHPLLKRISKKVEGRRKKVEYFVWNLRKNSLIIWDEDHNLAGDNTFNARMSRAATVQGVSQLFLGATSCDGPHKMKALGFALGLHNVVNYEEWAMALGAFRTPFRDLAYRGNPEMLLRLHNLIYGGEPPKGSRIRIADLGDKFPSSQLFTELYEVEHPEHIQRCYDELTEQLERLDEKEADDYDNELTLRLRARQRAELYKVPLLHELVVEHLNEGMSVAVFISFRDSLAALSDKLHAVPHSVIQGGMAPLEQQHMIDQFQQNKVRVILLIDAAGGVGINLHDEDGRFRRVTLVNPTDNPVIFKQVLGRAVRSTGKSPVIQKIVCAKGTAEETVYNNLRTKLHRINVINDADITAHDLDPIGHKKAENFIDV